MKKMVFMNLCVFCLLTEIAQTLQNTAFGKSDFCETTVFACANEIEDAQTLKNIMSGKMHFSEILIFFIYNSSNRNLKDLSIAGRN